jgi:hypothetical protein
LKPLFPVNASLKVIDLKTSDLVFWIDWRVPTEQRPNKRSHPIQIFINSDVRADYNDDPHDQIRRDIFITAYVKAKLNAFVDDGVAAPPINWEIAPGNTYAAGQLL